jgi:predicted TIM-barrel fold metal-dependent hydrolase
MIVDVHTHVWQTPDQLGEADLAGATLQGVRRVGGRTSQRPGGRGGRPVVRRIPLAEPEQHWQASRPADRAFVLGFKSRLLRADVPNSFVAEYVRRHPDKLIGFAGIDPTATSAADDLAEAREALGLRGIVISPSNQAFHPTDSRAMPLYAACERFGLPVVIHPGGHLSERSHLQHDRPVLLDEVARSFPRLRIILGQLAHPWAAEACVLLAKHPHVWADVGGLLGRPWSAYNALVLAYEHGVTDKLLFGSDFPFANVADSIEMLYSVNLVAQGTNLPIVPRQALRGIVERDALTLLGLAG